MTEPVYILLFYSEAGNVLISCFAFNFSTYNFKANFTKIFNEAKLCLVSFAANIFGCRFSKTDTILLRNI